MPESGNKQEQVCCRKQPVVFRFEVQHLNIHSMYLPRISSKSTRSFLALACSIIFGSGAQIITQYFMCVNLCFVMNSVILFQHETKSCKYHFPSTCSMPAASKM